MKKRVSGIFLALAMVLCFASVALFSADGTENVESSMLDTSSMVVNDTVYDDVAQLRAAEDNNFQNGEVGGSVAPTNTDCVEYVENGGDGRGEAHGSIAPINPDYIEYVESGEDENGKIPSMLDLSYLSQRYADSYANSNTRIDLPENYDLRDYGFVGPVQDQGNYGTCWSLSALGAAESSLMLRQFTSVAFSEKHLTWFALMGDEETEYIKAARNGEEYNPWTAGGTAIQALACLSAWKGPVYNYKMPYVSFDVAPDESLRYEADFHLQDCVYAYIGDYNISILHDVADAPGIQIIKRLILENGGYEVSYHAEWYGNRYFNESTSAIYHDDVTDVNHANLIVGWDDNYPKENFSSDCQPENDGAWLVRNSYGTGWGDEGYFWLSYEDKSIELQGTSYSFEDKDNYAKNYHYDTNGWTVSVAADDFIDTADASKVAYISNIFTAEGSEQLEAVSFYTTDVGTEYEISVYTGVENGNPVSGTLAYSGQTGYEEYCGYHTIELNSAVALAAGTNFSVVVKLTNPEYAYPIAVEAIIATTNPQYNGNGGESYYSADGKSWTDIVELGKYAINQKKASQRALYTTNVCLKAFTNPLPESGEAIGNVDFSLFEGEVALGSELELSGAENIHYTVTPLGGVEGAVMQYRGPITISEPCTITAWGEKNGKIGNKVSKTFTKQVSKLLELAIKAQDSGDITYLDLEDLDMAICFTLETDKVLLRPRGKDIITINGTVVGSDEWSEEIALRAGEINEITIKTEGVGKESSVYTLKIYVCPFKYDYQNETVIFDDVSYTITDADGNELKNGGSVTSYITEEGEEAKSLTVKNNQTGETFAAQIEQRPSVSYYAVDFESELTNSYFDSTISVSHSEDMSNSMSIDGYWCYEIEPEETIYIKRGATDTSFASSVFKLTAPARPAAPKAEIEEVGIDYVVISEVECGQYRISPDGEWQSSNKFEDLDSDTEYTFEVRYACTDESFASFSKTLSATIPATAQVKVRYEAYGMTVYEENQRFTEGESICYPTEDLTEKGYVSFAADKSQGKPITINNDNGVLIADPKEIVFEITPTINPADFTYAVNYWTEDGKKILSREFNFTHTEELEISEIEAPEGYLITGMVDFGQDYAAKLTYYLGKWFVWGKEINLTVAVDPNYVYVDDEDEDNTGDTTVVEFIVDENAAAITDETKLPQTGDNSSLVLWLPLFFVSGGAVTASTIANKKRKHNR